MKLSAAPDGSGLPRSRRVPHRVAYPDDATVQDFAVEPGAVDQVFGDCLAGDLLNVPARLRKPVASSSVSRAESGGRPDGSAARP